MQGKRTLIVIDADTNLIEDLQRRFMLEPDLDIVNVATLGNDGFNKVQQQQPTFVLVACPLPDVDVLQLLANLTIVAPNTKKIVALEVENPHLSTQCMQAGAQYVLMKPFSVDRLIEVFSSVGQRSSMPVQPIPAAPAMGIASATPVSQEGFSFDRLKGAMTDFSKQVQGGVPNPQAQPLPQAQPQQFQQASPFSTPLTGQPAGGQQGGFSQPAQPQMMPMQQIPQEQLTGMQGGGVGFRTLKQTIIAVNCPKGGVGKTTVSKELALAFAMVRVNRQPLKVLLADFDLDFGDVTSMLKLNPYPNITHWTADISQRLRENPTAIPRYTQQQIESKYLIMHPSGLRVLAAPSSHTDALDITGREVEIILDSLKNCDYDVIILDTGNNTKDYSLIALDKAHTILMVTTLDVTTINDTNLLLSTLRSIQFPTSKIQLIVNRMPRSDKDIDVGEISQVLRANIIGIIPEFPKIRQMNNAGTPAVTGRETEFTSAIRKIGNRIVPVFNKPVGGRRGKPENTGGGGSPFSIISKFLKRN